MEFVFLNDDKTNNDDFCSEHGLSIYIEAGMKLLFDTGQTDIYLKTAKSKGIDLSLVNAVVISHGHYDHGNGLINFPFRTNVIAHPDIFRDRYSIRTGEYGGLSFKEKDIINKFELNYHKDPFWLSENIVFLGEIPRTNGFELENFATKLNTGEVDYVHDDSALVIVDKRGLIIFSGCAHSGICNIIEYAKTVCKNAKVLAVIGGFHLQKNNRQLEKTIEYFKKEKIGNLFISHCTFEEQTQKITKELKDISNILITYSGGSYKL